MSYWKKRNSRSYFQLLEKFYERGRISGNAISPLKNYEWCKFTLNYLFQNTYVAVQIHSCLREALMDFSGKVTEL